MRRFVVFAALVTTASINVAAWGGKGHQIVADLAVLLCLSSTSIFAMKRF